MFMTAERIDKLQQRFLMLYLILAPEEVCIIMSEPTGWRPSIPLGEGDLHAQVELFKPEVNSYLTPFRFRSLLLLCPLIHWLRVRRIAGFHRWIREQWASLVGSQWFPIQGIWVNMMMARLIDPTSPGTLVADRWPWWWKP
jgi:hypothetical protein